LLRENFGATVDEVFTVNPTTVIDIRPGWTYFDEVHGTPAQAYSPATVGLPCSFSSASLFQQLPFVQFGSQGGNNTTAPTFGGDFASFLLGLPTSGDFVQAARASYHQWYTAAFVHDWRVNSHPRRKVDDHS
jgi:hypothetical protein